MTLHSLLKLMISIFIFWGLWMQANISYAQVMPDDFFYRFEAGAAPVLNVQVQNIYTDRTVEVETESVKVLNPGDKPEKLDKNSSVIVSPKKFVMKPKEKRVVRLLLKSKVIHTEEVYRVIFRPTSSTGGSANQKVEDGKKSINLTVLLGSGILVFAPPFGTKQEISWSKVGSDYIIRNTGNVNLVLTACDVKDATCEKSKIGGRIYAGKNFKAPAGKGAIKIQRDTFNGDKDFFTIDQPTGTRKFTE